MFRWIKRRYKGVLIFLISLIVGTSIPMLPLECFLTLFNGTSNINANVTDAYSFTHSERKSQVRDEENIQKKNKKLVFLGLLSSNQFLDTDDPAGFYDWINKIPGEVVFFGRENSTEIVKNIPMVRLKREYDSYTAQKKSFMILKYMYDRHLNDFEFFIQADDDVFIKPDKLEKFLQSINSSETLYISQMGKSNAVESDKSNSLKDENFCFEGAPGVILTRSMLAEVGPYIPMCLKSMYSTQEDIEMRRCIQKYTGISCTLSYEMKHILINMQSPFMDVERNSKILYPANNLLQMYNLQNYIHEKSITGYETEVISIMKELSTLGRSLNISFPLFDETRLGIFFSQLGETNSNHRPEYKYAVKPHSLIGAARSTHIMNSYSPLTELKSIIINQTISTILNVYYEKTMRTDQGVKSQWLDHIYLTFKSGIGFQQQIQYSFLFNTINDNNTNTTQEGTILAQTQLGSLQVQEYSKVQSNIKKDIVSNDEVVHFLLPLSGRYNTFERFMINYEKAILDPKEAVILTIVIYNQSSDGKTYEKNVLNLVKKYQVIHPHAVFKIVQGKGGFARGKALQQAADQWTSECLLFFIDVDIHFKRDVLNRIRELTKRGKQVFYPIVFSEFDPSASGEPPRDEQGHVMITEDSGYFRAYGFGMLSIYKSDLNSIGGFNLSIAGWGMEDIDLYTKIIGNSSLIIFRTVETSLDHVFHPPSCLSTFEKTSLQPAQQSQKFMCFSTMYDQHSSLGSVARRIVETPAFLDKKVMQSPGKPTKKASSKKLERSKRHS